MVLMPMGLLKSYVCVAALTSVAVALTTPFAGITEAAVFAVLGVVALFGLVDAVVNDMLPDRFVARPVAAWRYVIFIAIAGGNLSVLYQDVVYAQLHAEHLRYAADAVCAVLVSVIDYRMRLRAMKRLTNAALQHPVPA